MNAHNSMVFLAGVIAACGDDPPTPEQWAQVREKVEKYATLVAIDKLSGTDHLLAFLDEQEKAERQRNNLTYPIGAASGADAFAAFAGYNKLTDNAKAAIEGREALKHLGAPVPE